MKNQQKMFSIFHQKTDAIWDWRSATSVRIPRFHTDEAIEAIAMDINNTCCCVFFNAFQEIEIKAVDSTTVIFKTLAAFVEYLNKNTSTLLSCQSFELNSLIACS